MVGLPKRDCPCQGSSDRVVGCHASCPLYAEFKLKIEKEHEQKKKYEDIYEYTSAKRLSIYKTLKQRGKVTKWKQSM